MFVIFSGNELYRTPAGPVCGEQARPHQFNDGLAPAVAEEKLNAVSGMG